MHADYRSLPFPDGRFDAAIDLFTSLGYLGDEEDTLVLAEIRRVLRPGGRPLAVLERALSASGEVGAVELRAYAAGHASIAVQVR